MSKPKTIKVNDPCEHIARMIDDEVAEITDECGRGAPYLAIRCVNEISVRADVCPRCGARIEVVDVPEIVRTADLEWTLGHQHSGIRVRLGISDDDAKGV